MTFAKVPDLASPAQRELGGLRAGDQGPRLCVARATSSWTPSHRGTNVP